MATPSATGGAAAGTPPLGDEVAYIKATGGTIATLTVTKRVRPWTEFNDSDTPDSGSDDVAFEIQITPLGSRGDLIVKPDAFRRPDADGFLRARSWVTGQISSQQAKGSRQRGRGRGLTGGEGVG